MKQKEISVKSFRVLIEVPLPRYACDRLRYISSFIRRFSLSLILPLPFLFCYFCCSILSVRHVWRVAYRETGGVCVVACFPFVSRFFFSGATTWVGFGLFLHVSRDLT